ncbi:UDP-3-O-(3-hydroxymyristoyl)glucosamine N-acyltransferase [Paracoccaceae bacterium]|nr:UDP-3-O-(3-hydroxymyristoyl)glucosamine N-acyltransferase [Paracoccaceae bacterium]
MLTLEYIAKKIGAYVEGNKKLLITSPSEPKNASKDQLALALTPDYVEDMKNGNSRAALFSKYLDWRKLNLEGAIFLDKGKTVLYEINKLFHQYPKIGTGINSNSMIESTAKIGKKVVIGAFTFIGSNCEIGDNVIIYPNVTIMNNVSIDRNSIIYPGVRIFDNVKIGKNVICQSNSVIGSDGFSFVSDSRNGIEKMMLSKSDKVEMKLDKYLKVESIGSVQIHDNVEIGSCCTIDKGTISDTLIGGGSKLDNLVHVAHNVTIGRNCLICGQVGIAGSAKIGDRVVMGGQSGVGDNIKVGSDVILAGKTGLSVNAAPNQFLMGNPAMLKSKNIASYMAFRRLPRLIKMLKK